MSFDDLKISTETLRELTDDELKDVAGGAAVTYNGCTPSGATWFRRCEPPIVETLVCS